MTALPPGPELDKATALAMGLAMGLTIRHEGAALLVQLTKGGFWHVWRPSLSRQQACTVVLDWLTRNEVTIGIHVASDGCWVSAIMKPHLSISTPLAEAATPEHALCLAVLALSEAA